MREGPLVRSPTRLKSTRSSDPLQQSPQSQQSALVTMGRIATACGWFTVRIISHVIDMNDDGGHNSPVRI